MSSLIDSPIILTENMLLIILFCLLFEVINYDSPRGIKVQTEKSAQTTSKLIINKAMPNDSGNYSCSPSNAEPAHIAVHIHSNGNPAASIQHGKRSARYSFIYN